MEQYYLVINNHLNLKDENTSKTVPVQPQRQSLQANSPRLNKRKEQSNPSPGTMRRNISKDNFMKYQWAWTL